MIKHIIVKKNGIKSIHALIIILFFLFLFINTANIDREKHPMANATHSHQNIISFIKSHPSNHKLLRCSQPHCPDFLLPLPTILPFLIPEDYQEYYHGIPLPRRGYHLTHQSNDAALHKSF